MASTNQTDLVIFGASGFTGQFVLKNVLSLLNDGSLSCTVGVAGRNLQKLKDTVSSMGNGVSSATLDGVKYIVGDVNDENSLKEMCGQTKCLLNCVGPYRFYGENVVKACVNQGTHYLDICGEPQFLESMQLKYNDAAKAKNVFIIGSCGFDSIPCDIGVIFLQQQADGDVNAVESFFEILSGEHGVAGHYATYQSAIHGFAHAHELSSLRAQLFPKRLPKPVHKLTPRGNAFFANEVKGYCIPFMGADRAVVNRTQRFLYETEGKQPIQAGVYVRVGSLLNMVRMMFHGFIFSMMCKTSCGRSLLERHPKFFTGGTFSHEGPTSQQLAETSFRMTFYGWVYPKQQGGGDNKAEPSAPPQQTIVTRVEAPEPGYVATPICLIQAAITLLKEEDKMPAGGGVLTPGAAFAKTSLVERLNEHGVKFSVVKQ